MNRIYPILILLLTLNSCDFSSFGPGSQDFTKELPNGYMIFRSSSHQIQIVPEDGWGNETPIIPTKVLKLNIHDEFVIAYRQGLMERSPNDPNDSYMLPDPNKFDYWILDTKTPKSYGNLTKNNFEKTKIELKIPKSIKLIDVYEY
ncbi:DUF3997 domain-containing protein [Aquimarina rhabdastrellae]